MRAEARRVQALAQGSEDLQFCYDILNEVSRSFAIVIQQLPEELRDAVCVFYLVLRALDTVEDDMAFPQERKLPLLVAFHERISDECALAACPCPDECPTCLLLAGTAAQLRAPFRWQPALARLPLSNVQVRQRE